MIRLKKVMLAALVAISATTMTLMPDCVTQAATKVSYTQDDAALIEQNTTYSGEITSNQYENWYKIQAVDYTNYYSFTFQTGKVGTDLTCRLYFNVMDENGITIYKDSYWSNSNEQFVCKLTPSKIYYVKVSGDYYGQGGYSFSYKVNKDVADNIETAEYIDADKVIKDSIVIKEDEDFFKIKAVDYSSYYKFNISSISSDWIYYSIIDEDGMNVYNSYVGKNNSDNFKLKLESGKDYFIKVTGNNSYVGNYMISYSVKKDAADTKENAKEIGVNQTISENICVIEDEDWFKYKADYDQELSITMVNEAYNGTLNYVIYDKDVNKFIDSFVYGSGNKSSKTQIIYAGEYYIKVYISSDIEKSYAYNFRLASLSVDTCLKPDRNGVWRYYINGKQDNSKTGIVYDSNVGWWYVENGKVNFNYNDLYYDSILGWWKVAGGSVVFN